MDRRVSEVAADEAPAVLTGPHALSSGELVRTASGELVDCEECVSVRQRDGV
jgi:hypothetical protein